MTDSLLSAVLLLLRLALGPIDIPACLLGRCQPPKITFTTRIYHCSESQHHHHLRRGLAGWLAIGGMASSSRRTRRPEDDEQDDDDDE